MGKCGGGTKSKIAEEKGGGYSCKLCYRVLVRPEKSGVTERIRIVMPSEWDILRIYHQKIKQANR